MHRTTRTPRKLLRQRIEFRLIRAELIPTEKRIAAGKVNFLAGDSSQTLVQLLLAVFATGLVRIRRQVLQKLEKL